MSVLKDLWLIKKLGDDVAHVVCNEKEFIVPLCALPEKVREGDVFELRLQNGELLKRREEIVELFDSLKEH